MGSVVYHHMRGSKEKEMDDLRWKSLNQFLSRSSDFGNESGQLPNGYYTPGPELLQKLREESRVLVVGAGGLGCEILKVRSCDRLSHTCF